MFVRACPDVPHPAMLSDARKVLDELPLHKFKHLLGRCMLDDTAEDIQDFLDKSLTVQMAGCPYDAPLEDIIAHHPLVQDAWRN